MVINCKEGEELPKPFKYLPFVSLLDETHDSLEVEHCEFLLWSELGFRSELPVEELIEYLVVRENI